MADLLDRLFEKAASRLVPLAAHLDLTYRCNFRCSHCYLSEHGGPEMDSSQVLRLLDDLAREGTLFLTLSGGEVFLRQDLFLLLASARRLGFHVKLFTNGSMIDEGAADRLASLSIPEVHVSLYSLCSKTFAQVTGVPDSLEMVQRAVELLRQRGVKVILKCPLLRQAAADVVGVYSWAQERGCEVRFDTGIIPRRDGCMDPVTHCALETAALHETLGALQSIAKERLEPFHEEEDGDFPLCGAGRSTVHVEPSGRVNPCVLLPLPAGDLRAQPFREIWRESRMLATVRAYRQRDRRGCSQCALRPGCSFCMGRAYLETGQALAPARVLCHEAEARASLPSRAA
jgi:radical SAM protein with 4Fe4S-binding SPASM domain